jgi:hypothetical protein
MKQGERVERTSSNRPILFESESILKSVSNVGVYERFLLIPFSFSLSLYSTHSFLSLLSVLFPSLPFSPLLSLSLYFLSLYFISLLSLSLLSVS